MANMANKALPVVDCRGLICPMPIIQVRLRLNVMKKDDELLIYADDPTFESEFGRFCQLADISLISKQECGGFQSYHIRVLV
jgi:tRNA 2-thiouridine synthesizing protein A